MDRNKLISILQVYGILLVVLGHCFVLYPAKPLLFYWIYSFHMPLFFFISGYLFQYSSQRKALEISDMSWWGKNGLLWKKCKRLLIPYATISSLAFIPKILLNTFTIRPVEFSVSKYLEMLCYPLQNVIALYWFIPTLFSVFIIARLLFSVFSPDRAKINTYIILSIALGAYLYNPFQNVDENITDFFNIGGAVSYLVYFTTGIFCYRWDLIKKYLQPTLPTILLSSAISIAFITVIPDFYSKDLLSSLNGIVLSLYLCQIYEKRQWSFLNHLFGSSYAIYLFSWFPQTASQQIFIPLTHAPLWVGSLLALITGVYIPWLIYKGLIRYQKTKSGSIVAFLCGH